MSKLTKYQRIEMETINALRHIINRRQQQQKKIAIDAGISSSKMSQLLNFKRKLRLSDYAAICHACGIDPTMPLAIACDKVRRGEYTNECPTGEKKEC